MRKSSLVIAGTAWAVLLVCQSLPVLAAGSKAGIEISPVYQNVSLGTNQPSVTNYVTLVNSTPVPESFALSTVDFGSLNETGGVAFLGTSSSSYARKYGLSRWMKLNESSVTLTPGQSTNIALTIENSPSLSYGGHYGAILATAQTAPSGSKISAHVGVLEVLSSLFLLVKAGGPMPNLRVISQRVEDRFLQMPTQIDTLFQDQGDVHVVPRGVINITDPTGKLVARGALDVNSSAILPATLRKYSTPLLQLTSAWLPGYYKVSMVYRYDGTTATKTFVSGFWYFDFAGLWILVFLVLVLVCAGALYVSRKRWMPRLKWRRSGK